MNFQIKSYRDALTVKRKVFKKIYYLPDELVNIIKDFLVKKEWNYNVFMIKKHLKYENTKINIQPFSDVIKYKNCVYNKNILEYNISYDKDIDIHKTKKLRSKEYLLSKIKKKHKYTTKYTTKYKQKYKNYDKKIELTKNFLRKNTCLKCHTPETCEEPFVDFCNKCIEYYLGYGYENYYINSWNKYTYYSEDYECPCCVRDYRSCRYNFY